MAIKDPRPSGGRFSFVKNGLLAGAAEVTKRMLMAGSIFSGEKKEAIREYSDLFKAAIL
jgi:hypothetical protein